jgi:excisionase family DNA binding protein
MLMSVSDATRRFLTLDQVAEQFQLSRRTIERLVAADVMPSIRVGGSIRVPTDELDEWVDDRRTPNVPMGDGRAEQATQLRSDGTNPAERPLETSENAGQSSSTAPAGER